MTTFEVIQIRIQSTSQMKKKYKNEIFELNFTEIDNRS